jgi:hypothetical protein
MNGGMDISKLIQDFFADDETKLKNHIRRYFADLGVPEDVTENGMPDQYMLDAILFYGKMQYFNAIDDAVAMIDGNSPLHELLKQSILTLKK